MPLVETVESRAERGTPSLQLLTPSILRHFALALAVMVISAASTGCRKKSAVEQAGQTTQSSSRRARSVASAEIARDARLVTNEDLMSRDVELRRRTMQALARIADATARPALERGLSDDDSEVVTWAAFGLGRTCEKEADLAVNQLALRAVTWSLGEHSQAADPRASLQPVSAIVRALGRCGTPLAEVTLRNWLRLEAKLADESAMALGTIAARQHRLENATLVALLDLADAKNHELTSALFPFTRLAAVESNVQKRLLSVAAKSTSSKSAASDYAIRALPLSGEAAVPQLERVLVDKSGHMMQQRADAARGLSRLGEAGQQALGRALPHLLPRNASENYDWLLTEEFGLIAELLEQLSTFDAELMPTLELLAKFPISASSSPAIRRRISLLRCQAASALAGSVTTQPLLVACDPEKDGRQGALALSRVLGRAPIRARRTPLFEKLSSSSDVVVREHALRWLHSHPEIRTAAHILADALASDSPGVVATAANVLAEHPERAQGPRRAPKALKRASPDHADTEKSDRGLQPTPEIFLAMNKATHRAWEPDAIDVRAQLLDAVSSLGALSEKSFVEEQCRSSSVVLRQHAELALRNLGDNKRHCAATKALHTTGRVTLDSESTHLRFHTDIGPLDLWLEPGFAPMAASRLLELANNGFFNNMPVHRAVAGFIVQLGDRNGDGFGGIGLEVLRDELAPVTFRSNDVGLALSGPDTGSSQFFVVLGPHPHLDGEYTRVGRAEAGWNRLVVGDLILRAEAIH